MERRDLVQNAIFIFIIVFIFIYVFSSYLRLVQSSNYIYLLPGVGIGTVSGAFYLYGHMHSSGRIGESVTNMILSVIMAAFLGTLSAQICISEK